MSKPKRVDRGRDNGEALTEIRTVLSRAETARDRIAGPTEYVRDGAGRLVWSKSGDEFKRVDDPDVEDMRAALDQVVALLAPWRKTCRTTRSTCR